MRPHLGAAHRTSCALQSVASSIWSGACGGCGRPCSPSSGYPVSVSRSWASRRELPRAFCRQWRRAGPLWGRSCAGFSGRAIDSRRQSGETEQSSCDHGDLGDRVARCRRLLPVRRQRPGLLVLGVLPRRRVLGRVVGARVPTGSQGTEPKGTRPPSTIAGTGLMPAYEAFGLPGVEHRMSGDSTQGLNPSPVDRRRRGPAKRRVITRALEVAAGRVRRHRRRGPQQG